MKFKSKHNIIFGLAIALAFFLGRESKTVSFKKENATIFSTPSANYSNSLYSSSEPNNRQLKETLSDTVYRCGKSKIYHPTTRHASFRNCKSKVTKLSVQRAKNMGMRHCKCRG